MSYVILDYSVIQAILKITRLLLTILRLNRRRVIYD